MSPRAKPPVLAFRCRGRVREGFGGIRSEFASGELLVVPGLGTRHGEESRTRESGGPIADSTLRGTGGTRSQAPAWLAGTPHFQREGGPLGNCLTPMRGRKQFPGDGNWLSGREP
jgi:hypothetical protein